MPIEQYNTPRYEGGWRRNEIFADFEDIGEFFIELDYLIDNDCFVSRRCGGAEPALDLNICDAENGEEIFANLSADLRAAIEERNYRLLGERKQSVSRDERLCRVTEVYGYAPAKTYLTFSYELINAFGTEDPSGYLSAPLPASNVHTYNSGLKRFTLNLGSYISQFFIGDIIRLRGTRANGAYNNWDSPQVAIIAKTPTGVVCAAFGITFDSISGSGGGTISEQDAINVINRLNPSFWPGTISIIRDVSARAGGTVQANLKCYTTFYDAPPPTEQRFRPVDGTGLEVDAITASTTPTISEWKAMIAAGGEFIPAEAETGVLMGTVYRKTVKKAKCR